MTSTSAGICPRCGSPLKRKGAGRPPVWCSQRCRRAAYEERRAAAAGAIGLEVIDRVEIVDHSLNECVDRVLVSSTACRNVLQALARMVDDGTITPYGRWGSGCEEDASQVAQQAPSCVGHEPDHDERSDRIGPCETGAG